MKLNEIVQEYHLLVIFTNEKNTKCSYLLNHHHWIMNFKNVFLFMRDGEIE